MKSDMRAAIAAVSGQPCVVCGTPANGVAAYAPFNSAAYGARPGKQRLFFYALCLACEAEWTPEAREALFDAWTK